MDEKVIPSEHKKIMILDDSNHKMSWDALKNTIEDLLNIAENLDSDEIQSKLSQLLPDYKPSLFIPYSDDDRLEPFTIKGQA